jgi:hypothetical protein
MRVCRGLHETTETRAPATREPRTVTEGYLQMDRLAVLRNGRKLTPAGTPVLPLAGTV